jgi:methionine synthase II (cobalamin-independent)
MFKYAAALRKEIEDLHAQGFEYVQLTDPALVYRPDGASVSKDTLISVGDALSTAVTGLPITTCLQTFFGDCAAILPEALDFPVDHLGFDVYETDLDKLKEYRFDKGVALGLVDSRNSLIENPHNLAALATEILDSISSKSLSVFVCPNCDLEFLPWDSAKEKMKVVAAVAELLRRQANG